jgi:hypothetical protein
MSLLGALIGSTTGGLFAASQANQNIANTGIANSVMYQTSGQLHPNRIMKNKTLFSGRIEVQQVCNGYIVNIATREGYEFDTHIAATIKDVNDIIATAIVAFQLEA